MKSALRETDAPTVFIKLFAGLLGIAWALCTSDAARCESADTIRDVVLAGWLQNRDRLGSEFACRFAVETFDNTDPENPRLLFAREGVWAVSGTDERFSLECDDEQLVQVPQGEVSGRGLLPCASEHVLQTETSLLRYAPVMNVVNVHSAKSAGLGISITPLCYGVMGRNESRSLARILEDHQLETDSDSDVEVLSPGGDGNLIRLRTIRDERSGTGQWRNIMQWSVDPDAGFLPVEVVVFDDPQTWSSKTVVTETKTLADGGTWPWVSETVSNPETSPMPRLYRIETQSLEFDRAKVRDALSLPISHPATIVNPANMRSVFPAEQKSIAPHDIRALLAKSEAVLAVRGPEPRESISDRPSARFAKPFLVIALGSVVAGLLLFIADSRRKRRRKPSGTEG